MSENESRAFWYDLDAAGGGNDFADIEKSLFHS